MPVWLSNVLTEVHSCVPSCDFPFVYMTLLWAPKSLLVRIESRGCKCDFVIFAWHVNKVIIIFVSGWLPVARMTEVLSWVTSFSFSICLHDIVITYFVGLIESMHVASAPSRWSTINITFLILSWYTNMAPLRPVSRDWSYTPHYFNMANPF